MSSFLKASLLFAMFFLFACSNQTPSKEVVTESIKKIMPPNFEVITIAQLKEIPGVIEVSIKMDKQPVVLYMDKKAQYVLSGSLLHVESKKNLTIDAQAKIK